MPTQAAPCRYRTGKILGTGGYAVVKEAIDIKTRTYYACKVINKKRMEDQVPMVRNEVSVLEKVSRSHRNIITMHDCFETANNVYLCFDLCTGGELLKRIVSKRGYPEEDAACLVRTIFDAVVRLHESGIVHRDLKPENMLFKDSSEDADIMICDFGFSKVIDSDKMAPLSGVCGTRGYMAPEILLKAGYGKPVDVWSMGVTTYTLLSGYRPFDKKSEREEEEAVIAGDYKFEPVEHWEKVSETAKDFIKCCLTVDPAERPSARDMLEHKWLLSSPPPSLSPGPEDFNRTQKYKEGSNKGVVGENEQAPSCDGSGDRDRMAGDSIPPSTWTQEYRTGKTLSANSRYFVIKEAVHIRTGTSYTCKIINKKLMEGRESLIVNEVFALKKVSKSHRNIVTLHDYFETAHNVYLYFDLYTGGELFDRIAAKGKYHERDAAYLVRTIFDAVACLHEFGIVHRNLKPENMVFKDSSEDADILIRDLHLSGIVDSDDVDPLTGVCGTHGYMAPEILLKAGYGKPVDIWAMGVTTYFLLSGYRPFDRKSEREEEEVVIAGDFTFEPVGHWENVSETAKDFIKCCLTVNPANRPSARDMLKHKWLSSISHTSRHRRE